MGRSCACAMLALLLAYILLTPWSHYWYLVAPLALVAAQPEERLTAPVLTLSGTALVTVWLSPSVWYQVIESAFRYGPGIAVAAVLRPKRRTRWPALLPEPEPEPERGSEAVIPEPVIGSKPSPEPVAP